MADNTSLNPGSLGDTIRTIQRPATQTNTAASVKTEVVQIDFGGDGISNNTPESLLSSVNPLPVVDSYSVLQAQIAYQQLLLAQAAQIGGYVPLDPSIAAVLGIQS